MPWMPEVFSAPIAEARRTPEDTRANDAIPYYEGIMADEPDALIRSFAGQPILDDPRVGRVVGARGLRDFVSEMADWLRMHDTVVENMALTRTSSTVRLRRSYCTCSEAMGAGGSTCRWPS